MNDYWQKQYEMRSAQVHGLLDAIKEWEKLCDMQTAQIKKMARGVYVIYDWLGLKINGHDVIAIGGVLYDKDKNFLGTYYCVKQATVILTSGELYANSFVRIR